MIESRLLEHAIAVAEHGSFALAAQSLGLSQPALSRSIQSLESQLEIQLFDRGHRRVEPTDAGQIFLQHAREIVARNGVMLKEMGQVQENQSTSFTVAAGPYPAEAIVGKAFANLIALHPGIQLRLNVANWVDAVKMVRSREADLCVAEISQIGDDPELHVEPLPPLKGYFVVRAGHPLLQLAAPTAEQIFSYPIVSTSRVPPRVLSPLQQQRATVPGSKAIPFPAILCEQVSVMQQIIAHSEAIGMFVLPTIEDRLENGTLVLLAYDTNWLGTEFGIIRARNRPLSAVGTSLAQCLHELAERMTRRDLELTLKHVAWQQAGSD
ncbi:LysR family transcriptional regulator [Anatilimnocola sp. NA78]|uniref:LysR family transcriptional regulator n=1 Tax=Anatilimnocola sp. NA78 TaxID=3415683 RepID=UPI003CE5BB2B